MINEIVFGKIIEGKMMNNALAFDYTLGYLSLILSLTFFQILFTGIR